MCLLVEMDVYHLATTDEDAIIHRHVAIHYTQLPNKIIQKWVDEDATGDPRIS